MKLAMAQMSIPVYCIKSRKGGKTIMSLTVNLYYTGINGNAKKFADEMESSGTANAIRAEKGNLRYDYFIPMNDSETVLLIDSWESQDDLDMHHASPMMKQIASLREKYDLHMNVERYISSGDDDYDKKWIRR